MKKYIDILLKVFQKHKYIIILVAFFIWMMFFDEYNFIMQYKLSQKIRKVKKEIEFYDKGIAGLQKEYDALTKDINAIERYGREKFFLKKENEDIFVLVPKKEK